MSPLEHPRAKKILAYRAKSLAALDMAANVKDPDAKKSWELIAEGYHDLAEQLQRNSKL